MEIGKKELFNLIEKIEPADGDAIKKAEARQVDLLKPPGSLGRLEEISVKIAGITGKYMGNSLKKQAILVFSGDNGIWDEGVAVAPQTVTSQQTINITRRITGVGSMSKYFGIDVLITDLGVKEEIDRSFYTDTMIDENGKLSRKIIDRKLRKGSRNFAKEPALTEEEAVKALVTGIEAAAAAKNSGCELVGVGEMGIGNTTCGTAVLGAITGAAAEEITGRGGGLNDEGLRKKKKVIDDALSKYKDELKTPLDIIRCFGGYEIAGMAGAYLGAALYKMPVVIDGYISIVAALLASEFNKNVTDYMFASHKSYEKGYILAQEALGLKPMFELDMRLGEGSGCPIAFKTIEAATAEMNLMKTFAEGEINDEYIEEVREENLF